jgi:hypothetical protein
MLLEHNEVTRRAFVLALRHHGVIEETEAPVPPEILAYFQTLATGPVPDGWAMQIDVEPAEQARITWCEMLVVPLDHPLVTGFVAWADLPGELLRDVARLALEIDRQSGVLRKAGW